MSAALNELAEPLLAAGAVTADDVLALRREVYSEAQVSFEAIQALVTIEAAARDPAPEWVDFFAEALVDYMVHQADPPDYVDPGKADWLMGVVGAQSCPASTLEALTQVLEAASEVPANLASLVLEKVKGGVVAKGQVSAADAALLRRVIFAGGGEANIGVSREEAEALFDVNDACAAGANDPTWNDVFAGAITDHLTAVSPFRLESRAEAERDEAWLEGPDSLGRFAAGMVKAPDVAGFVHDILDPAGAEEREWEAPVAAMEVAEADAAQITDEEARWLIGRLSRGALSAAERALIERLRVEAPQSSGLLQPLLGAGGAGSPAANGEETEPAADFGRRRAMPA
jgi:hypothetical protein